MPDYRDLIANKVIPAPEGEDNNAYNAAVITAIQDELIGPVEHERMGKTMWARLLVGSLLKRIANLRALHADGRARGRQEGLEGVIHYLASNGNPIWKKAAVAAIRNFMETPDE